MILSTTNQQSFIVLGPRTSRKQQCLYFKVIFLRCEKEGTNYFCFCGTHQLDFHLIVKAKYFTSQISFLPELEKKCQMETAVFLDEELDL